MAGWRDDAVPEREEHELGRCVPHPGAGPLAREDPAGTVSNEIVQRHDWLPTFLAAAGEPEVVEKLKKGHTAGDKTFKVHIDGYNLLPYLTGEVDKSPRQGFVYFSDDGDVLALRFDNWKVVFMEQRVQGTIQLWAEPFVVLRLPKLFNLRTDSVRAGGFHLEHLLGLGGRQRVLGAGGDGRDDGVPRHVRGVPTAAESGELHDRPGGRETRGDAHVRSLRRTMEDPLSLWNNGDSKSAIVDFVDKAARDVPHEERIAVFDNDGTLWCEKPMPIQLDFILRRLSAMAEATRVTRASALESRSRS